MRARQMTVPQGSSFSKPLSKSLVKARCTLHDHSLFQAEAHPGRVFGESAVSSSVVRSSRRRRRCCWKVSAERSCRRQRSSVLISSFTSSSLALLRCPSVVRLFCMFPHNPQDSFLPMIAGPFEDDWRRHVDLQVRASSNVTVLGLSIDHFNSAVGAPVILFNNEDALQLVLSMGACQEYFFKGASVRRKARSTELCRRRLLARLRGPQMDDICQCTPWG